MSDDGGDWFADVAEEAPPVIEPPGEKKKKKGGKKKAGAETEAPEEEATQEIPTEESVEKTEDEEKEDEYLDPDKLILFKHWIRPKFLQYDYLYNYRHNYYDDVIDYLDRRQRGLLQDVPRAQTWGERVLRTYNSKRRRAESSKKVEEDVKLVTKIHLSAAFQRYHTKEYINRRFYTLLY